VTKRLLADHRRELSVAAAFAVLLVALAVRAPDFYRTANLRDVLVNAAPTLVAGVGMTLVIVARQIDISIGSQFAICGVVAGVLAKHVPMPAAALGAIGAGALLGACNGLLVGLARLPAIVVTLATMVGWREALRWSTGGLWVRDLPAGFQWLGMGQDAGRVAVLAFAFAVWAVAIWGARYTAAGRSIYAVGSDEAVARLLGLRPRVAIFGVFVAMGALTGLAALVSAIQFVDVQTNAGVGFELRVIAATVVGGTRITGGRGSLGGTLLGVLLLATVGPALSFLGSHAYWDRALYGVIILTAVAGDATWGRAR
jgi:ribose/xylose/arabinose/galactoside ABC-type transport system permease subunit